MMGSEAMRNAAQTCTECVTTPSIIVEDLKVCILHFLPSYAFGLSVKIRAVIGQADCVDVHRYMRNHLCKWYRGTSDNMVSIRLFDGHFRGGWKSQTSNPSWSPCLIVAVTCVVAHVACEPEYLTGEKSMQLSCRILRRVYTPGR